MNAYDADHVLDSITDNWVAVVAIGGISIIAMFVFFIEGARAGARDKVYPMSLWMTAIWFPHDWSYLFHAGDWFGGEYDHWFMQLFWFAIIVTAVSETVYAFQSIRYGREKMSPGYTQTGHTLRILGAILAGVVAFALVKKTLGDDLYLMTFMATLLMGAPAASGALNRHPDGKGQAMSTWIGYSIMAVFYSIASITCFGGEFFHSWQYVGICVAACLWSFVVLYDMNRAGVPWTTRHPSRRPADATEREVARV